MKSYRFNGPEFDAKRDGERLSKQHDRIRVAMQDREWRTLDEISVITGDPQASISAQLRHLRKPRFGEYLVQRRLRPGISGLYEYRVLPPSEPQMALGLGA